MNKKIIIYILIILVITVGVTAYLNRGNIEEKEKAQENALLTIQRNDEDVETVDFSYIQKREENTFNKDLDTSDSGPVEHSFTGVPLKNIINEVGLNLENFSQVIIKSVDGYTVALTAEEVKMDDNVYLVYKNDGEFLKSKKEGGTGPYRIVIKEDQFGQRWSKFVTEVNLK